MMKNNIAEILADYIKVKRSKITEKEIETVGLSFMGLRDYLLKSGTILEEDIENQVYIAELPSGFANMNTAVFAFQMIGNQLHIAGYAREGIINQHTVDKAMQKIQTELGH